MTNLSERGMTPHAWEAFVSESRKNPMNIDLQGVQEILDRLNTKALATNYEFHLHQVVDGVTPPERRATLF